MENKHALCEVCLNRDCRLELCSVYSKRFAEKGMKATLPDSRLGSLGQKAAVGAGVGALATGIGIAVTPLVGITAAIGIALTIKVWGRGGLIGAGVNMAVEASKKTEAGTQPQAGSARKKRRSIIF